MRAAPLVTALLLAAGLAGCIGGDDADAPSAALDPAAQDQAARLPPGLTMEAAEETSYNETSVTWQWTAEVPPAGIRSYAITSFDVPAELRFSLELEASWSSLAHDLVVEVLDGDGVEVCRFSTPVPEWAGGDGACRAQLDPLPAPEHWEVEVSTFADPTETPVEIELTLTALPTQPARTDGGAGIQAPTWAPGEWWTVRVTDPLTRSSTTLTQVVADVEDGIAWVGTTQPLAAQTMLLGIPALGAVQTGNLTWNLRGEPFQAMTFPPEPGTTWETTLRGYDVTATVQDVRASQVVINYTTGIDYQRVLGPADFTIELIGTYDTEAGTLVRLEHGAGMSWRPGQHDVPTFEVLAHGTGYDGPVHVPTEQTLVFNHGVKGSYSTSTNTADRSQAAAVDDVVEIQEPFTHLAFVQIVGRDIDHYEGDTLQQVGYYHEHAYWDGFDGRDRENWEFVVPPTEVSGLHTAFHDVAHPQGAWNLARTSFGPGVSMTQGLAYTLLIWDAPGDEPEVLG